MIFNEDCITGAKKHLTDASVALLICDPPFGINESKFEKHYNRNKSKVIEGYQEAPKHISYRDWTTQWMIEAKRVLMSNGSFYLISGHSKLLDVMTVADSLGFETINHIIWKYAFGVHTSTKFVTSHYHILYLKHQGAKVKFNANRRFSAKAKLEDGNSALHADMEDVWVINKEYITDENINNNKLPSALVEKMISYSSDPNDVVCDFFLGNFTTAKAAKEMGRIPTGFELNKNGYDYHMDKMDSVVAGCKVENLQEGGPENQGKALDTGTISAITDMYVKMRVDGKHKNAAINAVCDHFKRGYFGVLNLLEAHDADEKVELEKRQSIFDI